MRCTRLPSFEYRRERWRNGLGWTREILRSEPGEDWAWRCSVAEVDADGEFSRFPGRQRLMALLQGGGMELQVENGEAISLLPPHDRAAFPGDAEVRARLLDGPCHAFNFIHDPARCTAQMLHRPLVGPMVFFSEPAESWLIYLLNGHAAGKHDRAATRAETGDTLLLEGDRHGGRVLLEGAGELLMLRLRQRAPGAAPAAP